MLKPVNLFFIVAILVSRFLPHPPNFTPIIAIFMASGGLSLVPLLVTYLFTDAILGFHSSMIWVYASLFAIGYLQKGPIVSSLLFFIITNFAVWTSGYYGYDLEGLLLCYTMAIPFFINTLASTLIFYNLIKYYQNNIFPLPRLLTPA
tara:strand:- start:127 stop:570 length:444 start_codon:yes stop_codon:yes gene_type:complete